MALIQTTIRINETLYDKLKDCKTEYKQTASVNVSLNKLINIAVKEFLADDPITILENQEVF